MNTCFIDIKKDYVKSFRLVLGVNEGKKPIWTLGIYSNPIEDPFDRIECLNIMIKLRVTDLDTKQTALCVEQSLTVLDPIEVNHLLFSKVTVLVENTKEHPRANNVLLSSIQTRVIPQLRQYTEEVFSAWERR